VTSGLGRGRGEAIRNVYLSDRQLPPGYDPGADCGEAPDGQQRGSQPCNILVVCCGYHMQRREVHTQPEDHFVRADHGEGDCPNLREVLHGKAEARQPRPSRQPRR
jgi:hypothetical protein